MEKGELKEYRMDLLADVLIEMEKQDAFPQSNINRLAETMMEYWREGDYEDMLQEHGYSWRPHIRYIKHNTEGIRSALVSKRKYFIYYRTAVKIEKGKKTKIIFSGSWKFVDKKQYNEMLIRDNTDIATRVDTHNQRIDDGKKKWKMDIPHIAEVPLLNN
ncbi:MAG TPA: hypothetical protein ENH82_00885 [bacterium]|nr:hypothetical protein [bacterium]